MKKKNVFALVLAIGIMLMQAVCIHAAEKADVTVSRAGTVLKVSGNSLGNTVGSVAVKAFDGEGNLLYMGQVETTNTGAFSVEFAPGLETTQTISIYVRAAGETEPQKVTFLYEMMKNPDIERPSGGGGGGTPGSGGSGNTGGGGRNQTQQFPDTAPIDEINLPKNYAFADLEGHWAASEITSMASQGIVKGDENGNFDPDRMIKRGEFLSLIVRVLQLPKTEYSGSFADVKVTDWFAGEVQAALNNGLIAEDVQFRPEETITREEMAKIVVGAAEQTGIAGEEKELAFQDNSAISDWAVEFVQKAASYGLINGNEDGSFAPQKNATRAEAAVVIKRLVDKK